MRPEKLIIVCATQRSGSTMICEDMHLAGTLGRANEHFNPWINVSDKNWSREIETVFAKGTGSNGVFSVKVMANQIGAIDNRIATFSPSASGEPLSHFASFFRDATWVWVRRADTLAQAISLFIAQETGIFHVVARTGSGFVPGKAVHESVASSEEIPYDFKKIIRDWNFVNHYDLLWSSFFSVHGIRPLEIEYEDAAKSSVAVRIAQACGLTVPASLPPRNLRKGSPDRSSRVRKRFMHDLLERAAASVRG